MSLLTNVHVGDVGTLLVVTVQDENGAVVDISTASTKQILLKKPDKTTLLTKAASFATDGKDGVLNYTTIAGDVDQAGDWQIQAKVILPTGTWFSTVSTFQVDADLT